LQIHYKRTITHPGSCEYRIDNALVSAAQYNQALESHNILIKARNFLVFQGDVETIASQSPKDLTKLIEQISGSLEYKPEYDKLKIDHEKAAQALARSFHERRGVNAEVKQYQEQKIEAETYATKLDKRDDAVVTHILWKLYHLQAKIDASRNESKHDQLALLNNQIQEHDLNLDEARKMQSKLNKNIMKQERVIKRKEKTLQDKLPAVIAIDEKISLEGIKLKKYLLRIESIKTNRQALVLQDLQTQLLVVEKAAKKFDDEQAALARKKGTVLSDHDLQEYRSLTNDLSKEAASEKARLTQLLRQQKTEQENLKNLQGKLEQLEWQANRLLEKDLASRRDQVQSRGNIANSDKRASRRPQYCYRQQEDEPSRRIVRAYPLQICANQLLQVNADQRESEKQVRLKDTVLSLKRIFPGVKGRIVDLCSPSQRRYDAAIGIILGRNADAIVVETETVAKECIEYLRDQKSQPRTFIPLDAIQTKPINPAFRGIHRQAQMAIDILRYETCWEKAMHYACGNAIVCDDSEIAKHLAYEKKIDSLHSTEPSFIKPSPEMGRPGSLQRLKESLVAELAELQRTKKSCVVEDSLKTDLGNLQIRLSALLEKLNDTELNLAKNQAELDLVQRQIAEMTPNLDSQRVSHATLTEQIEKLQETVNVIQDRIFAPFSQKIGVNNIREYEGQQGKLQQEAAEQRLQYVTQLGKLQNQIEFESSRLKDCDERLERLTELMQRDNSAIEGLARQREILSTQMDQLEAELEILRQILASKRGEYAQVTENVNERKRAASQVHKQVNIVSKQILALHAQVERLMSERYAVLRKCKLEEIAIPLVSGSLDNIPIDEVLPSEDILQSPDWGIEIDFDELDDDLKQNGSENQEQDLIAQITALTNELQTAPNMKAIDRLQGVESKLHTLEKDFDKSRRAAKITKDKFNTVRRKRCNLVAFEHISEQIDQIYKDLTKTIAFPLGGTAYLSLEDEQEPYLDGVKYHAMPPMKRFRDMDQLSGGEKTMAALALLFAVHSYQPSPFFVLDEIDAALDNTNVAKIAAYIKEHAGPGFQFVVISLKNGLFHQSDALVGIYREQQQNSSKCLTLDLRKYDTI
ncbi:Structural maintenance of chromosomes protein 1, partial [Neolecta irregularis DAH-3]